MKDRAMAFVHKNGKTLMVNLFYQKHLFWALPGGGIEEGETPEQAAIRELKEETGIDGEIVRPLSVHWAKDGHKEYSFLVKMKDENQEAVLGYDPEEEGAENPPLRGVAWKSFDELSRKDQDFMMTYGFMEL